MESPKTRLLKDDPKAKRIAALINNDFFEEACDVAMLEFVSTLPLGGSDMNLAAANEFRSQGAKRFVAILSNITNPATAPELPRSGNLDHSLKA